MNPGIEFEFAFLWNVVGQILILCRTCMMRKWSSIKTKTKPLARPGKKAVAKSKHCRWILMPCCPISGKWGATRLIHVCFMAKHCQINLHLIFDYSTYRRSKSKVKISQNFVAFSEYMNLTKVSQIFSHSSFWAMKPNSFDLYLMQIASFDQCVS